MSACSEMEAGQVGEDGGGDAATDAEAAAVLRCVRWGLAAAKASAAVPSKGVAVALDLGRTRSEEKIGSGGGDGAGEPAAGKAGLEGRAGENGEVDADASSSRRRELWVGSCCDAAAEEEEEKGREGTSKSRRKARYPAPATSRAPRHRRCRDAVGIVPARVVEGSRRWRKEEEGEEEVAVCGEEMGCYLLRGWTPAAT